MPLVMMMRLCPGWLCQPVVAPTCQVLLWMKRSELPLVFCQESQTSLLSQFFHASGGMTELKTLISPNVPVAIVTP